MFNLERAITEWRRRMAEGGIGTPDLLDELESHLRDEIERQLQSGVEEERAYQAAVAGIGKVTALRTEFAKIGGATAGARKFSWTFYFASVVFLAVVNAWTLLEYELSAVERVLGFSFVLSIASYLACLPHLLRSLPVFSYMRLIKVTKVFGTVLVFWPMFAILDALQVVNLKIGIVPSMVIWCLYAAAALSALAHGLIHHSCSNGEAGGLPPPFQPQTTPIPPTHPAPPDFAGSLPPSSILASAAREALAAASEEASRLGHDFIGTEHVLLAVLKRAKGSFESLLQKIHLDREAVQLEIERLVSPLPAQAGRTSIPLTPRACRALRLAAKEARKLKQTTISDEHIFLGLILEGTGLAGRVLKNLGVRIESTREELFRDLRTH